MNCCDSPWLFAAWAFCFAEDTFLCQQNFIANFVVIIDLLAIFACRIKIGLRLPVISNFVPVGYERNIKEHIATKYRCTWRGFMDCVIGRANGPCALSRKASTPSGVIFLAISSLDVCNICARTWCKRSKLAFACGFFIVVGLRLIPYVPHRYSRSAWIHYHCCKFCNDILGIYSTTFYWLIKLYA